MKHLALLVAVTLAAPAAARADEAASSVPAKARALADKGRAAHDAGDYNGAIVAFTQAYAMAPAPALLFNLAQAYRLQGNCDDAALMYRRYLDTNPSPEARALAEGHLATVERCMHKIALGIPIATPAVATTSPGGMTRGHALTATARVDGPSRKAELEKDIGIGLAIGGTASLAVAGYFALRAHNAADDVADAYKKGGKWKDIQPIDERGKTASSRAWGFGIGGAIGVTAGVVTYLVGRHTETSGRTFAVAPTGRGVQVGMSWAF
jgi:tetratricopeptide (TPR) repeat protein